MCQVLWLHYVLIINRKSSYVFDNQSTLIVHMHQHVLAVDMIKQKSALS